MVCLMAGFGASAVDFAVGSINYSTLDDNTVKIIASPGAAGKVTIPEKVTNEGVEYTVVMVGPNAFTRCSGMSEIILPETVTEIGSGAFTYDFGLKNIPLPSSLVKIGDAAFYQCTNLQEITIPASVKVIESRAFSFTSAMKTFTVDPANENYSSEAGVLYNKDKTHLVACPRQMESVTLPSTLKVIEVEGFCGCSKITELVLPEGLETLQGHAIQGTSVTSLTIPNTVTLIDDYSLAENYKLTYLKLSENAKSIGEYCFWSINSLNELNIPASVTQIKRKAFSGVTKLPRIVMGGSTPPGMGADVFEAGLFKSAKLVVPAGSLNAYKGANIWSQFENIEEYTQEEENEFSVGILENFTAPKVPVADKIKMQFSVKNEGTKAVTNIAYVLTIDGTAGEAKNTNLAIAPGAVEYLNLSEPIAVGKHTCSLAVTKVNGQDNANSKASKDFEIEVVNNNLPEDAPMAAIADFNGYDGLGNINGKTHLEAAARFDLSKLKGCKVLGVSLGHLPSSGLSNMKIWVSTDLPDNASALPNATEVAAKNGEVKGAFVDPYIITDAPFYAGIAGDFEGVNYPIPYSGPKNSYERSLMFNSNYSRWADYSGDGTLPIILYLEGDIKADAMSVEKLSALAVNVKGKELTLPVEIVNYGTSEITTVEYTYTGGGQNVSANVDLTTGKYIGQKSLMDVQLKPFETPGNYDITLTVNKVNGNENTVSDKSLTFNYSVGDFVPSRRPVLEEMTGTNCGFCPRGTIALNAMKERHEDFIGAAYHKYNSNDPMYFMPNLPFRANGAPSGMMDRDGVSIDPYYGQNYGASYLAVEDYWNMSKGIVAPADIDMETSWNADSTEVNVKSTCLFSYAEPEAGYTLGYILTLDGISHPDEPAWRQDNYYFGNTDPGVDSIISKIYHAETFDVFSYNHVVFHASLAKGVAESIPATIKAGESCEDVRTISILPNSWSEGEGVLDEDLSKVNVIALLVDKNGRIRNAQEVRVGESVHRQDGISQNLVNDENLTATYYDLMGRRVQNPQHGIYVKVCGNKASKVAL